MLVNIFKIVIFLNYLETVLAREKVIIIGAGPSGIAAATRLLENGFNDFLILEAEPRIGGRINTVSLDDAKIDLGAQWCDGQKGNVVYEILNNLRALELTRRDHFPKQFYISSRNNISFEFSEELGRIISDVDKNRKDAKENLGLFLKKRYIEMISKKYNNDHVKLNFAQLAESYLAHLSLRVGGPSSWYDTVADDADQLSREGHALGWKNGFVSFLDVLTRKYPDKRNQLAIDDKIHLNKEVVKITYDVTDTKSTPIEITCSDNSSYIAKHVIFTPSLGVLKERSEYLFEPHLPEAKITAIRNLGYGAVLKVFVKFKTRWWGKLPGFNLVWTEDDRITARDKFPYGPTNQKGESWVIEHYNIFAMPDSSTLLVWYTGEMVKLIEIMDKDTLQDGIYYTLNLFLGHLYNIPKPLKLVRSNWNSNQHFRGTNSFASLNSTREDRRNLQSPVKNIKNEPVLQFAGEATSIKLHSSVQGAIESGFREADTILELPI